MSTLATPFPPSATADDAATIVGFSTMALLVEHLPPSHRDLGRNALVTLLRNVTAQLKGTRTDGWWTWGDETLADVFLCDPAKVAAAAHLIIETERTA